MTLSLQALQNTESRGLNLSLLKLGPIVQVSLGTVVTALVLVATAATFGVVITRVKFEPPEPKPDVFTIYKSDTPVFDVLKNDNDPREKENLFISAVSQPLFGHAEISHNKKMITFKPAYRFAGTTFFNYTCSNTKLSVQTTVTVHIKNHGPEAVEHWVVINKNSEKNALNVISTINKNGVKCSDVDPGEQLSIKSVTLPENGEATFDRENVYYTPKKKFNGKDSLTYVITDGNDTANSTIYYQVVNNPPQANPDHYVLPMNKKANLEVLANDVDINNDLLKIIFVGFRGKGTLRLKTDNEGADNEKHYLEYLPQFGFQGVSESFEYTITDGTETSSTYGTILVKNTPPQADNFEVVVPKNTQDFVVPNFNSKFRDPDEGSTLTVQIIGGLQNTKGSFSLTSTQKTQPIFYLNEFSKEYKVNEYQLTFTPAPTEVYTDQLVYEVYDGADRVRGTITFKVVNTPPNAVNDVATCPKNQEVKINVISNDNDPNGDLIHVKSASAVVGQGTAERFNDSHVKYVAPAGQVGNFTFTYTIEDIQNNPTYNLEASASVTVQVVNTEPKPKDDVFTISKGLTSVLHVLSNDVDPNGDVLKVQNLGQTKSNVVPTITQESGVYKVSYTALNSKYTDYFTYEASDGELSAPAKVTINVINDPPVPKNDEVSVHWGSSIEIKVLENDEDVNPGDKSILEVASITSPYNGTAVISGKSIVYKPNPLFVGDDSFTYKVKDSYDTSATSATVVIHVTNTPPVAASDSGSQLWGTTAYHDVISNDSDPDKDPISFSQISQNPTSGTASWEYGKIKYIAVTTTGSQVVKYKISDSVSTSEGTLTIQVTNQAPIAADDSLTIHWSNFAGATIDVLANDRDADLNPITINEPLNIPIGFKGTVTVATDKKSLKFVPVQSDFFIGTQSFKYTITDGQANSAEATVYVTITNNNVPQAPNQAFTVHWRTALAGYKVPLGSATQDLDGDTLTLSNTNPNQGGTATSVSDVNGKFITYTHANFLTTGNPETFTYTFSDGQASATGTISFTVYDNAPTAKDYYVNLPFDQINSGASINVLADSNDVDSADQSSITITAISTPARGTITSGTNANPIVYKPNAQWKGEDSFTFTISDGLLTTTKTITVNTLSSEPTPQIKNFVLHWKTQTTGTQFDVMVGINDSITGTKLELNGTFAKNPSHGTATIVTNLPNKYYIHYQQTANYLGSDDFQAYYVNNGLTSTVSIYVNIYNTIPTATSKTVNTHWGKFIDVDLLNGASDGDAPNDSPSLRPAQSYTCSQGGSVQILGDGKTARYTPKTVPTPFVGQDQFYFDVWDGLSTITRTVTIDVQNSLPQTSKKTYSIHWRQHVAGFNFSVMQGDTDPDVDDTLLLVSASNLSPISAGTITANLVAKTVNFKAATPSTFRNQDATFSYVVTDGAVQVTQQVQVTVTNAIPVANGDVYNFFSSEIDYQNGKLLNVLSNDDDTNPEDKPLLQIKNVVSTTPGASVSISNNQIKYIPPQSFLGTDSFTYQITDGMDDSQVATVSITITAPLPTVQNFTQTLKWNDPPYRFNLLQNATGESLEVIIRVPASYGNTADVGDKKFGVFDYTPFSSITYTQTVDGKEQVVDTFSFTAKDKFNREVTGQVSVTIWNRKPQGNPDPDTFAKTAQNPQKSYAVLTNDVDDESLTINTWEYTGQGIVSKSQDSKNILYNPLAGWSGTEIIKYKATDGQLVSDWTTVTVTVTNVPPVCKNVSKTVDKGTSNKPWDLKTDAECTDQNGDSLTLSLPTGVDQTKGIVAMKEQNVTYTHKPKRSGTHEFNFQVSDGTVMITNKVTVSITNNPPSCSKITKSYNKANNAVYYIDVVPSCTDQDTGDVLTLKSFDFTGTTNCLNDPSIGGTLSIENGQLKYQPRNGFFGTCNAFYTVGDSDVDGELVSRAEIQITVQDNKPVAVDDAVSSKQGVDAIIPISTLLANDYDNDTVDVIEFVELDCSTPGHCYRTPYISGANVILPSDPTNCNADKFKYSIRQQGDLTYKAYATVTVTWTQCTCHAQIDVTFLIDGSGSITGTNWGNLVSFVKEIASKFVIAPDKMHVALVQYANYPRLEFGFSSDAAIVTSNIEALSTKQLKGGTGTIKGFEKAYNVTITGRSGVNKVIVLMTDGVSNVPFRCKTSSYWSANENLYYTCQKWYGGPISYFESKCSSPFYPNRTCYDCVYDVIGGSMPCADPRKKTSLINAIKKGVNGATEDWKIVALGIGDELLTNGEYGWNQVKLMSYDPAKAIQVSWSNLNQVVNAMVDESCNQN